MLRIKSNPTISTLVEEARALKALKDEYTQKLKEKQQELLDDPVIQQALYNEMNKVNERGTALTGTLEVYDPEGTHLMTITSVGWKLQMNQPNAHKYLREHPEAAVFLETQVKPKTRELLKAASSDPDLVETLGLSYDVATPSVRYI